MGDMRMCADVLVLYYSLTTQAAVATSATEASWCTDPQGGKVLERFLERLLFGGRLCL